MGGIGQMVLCDGCQVVKDSTPTANQDLLGETLSLSFPLLHKTPKDRLPSSQISDAQRL